MVWPFSKKPPQKKASVLVFKSGEAFFKYQCKFGVIDIIPGEGMISLVLDGSKEFNLPSPVKILENGVQRVVLKVASEDEGFIVVAETLGSKGDRLKPGDIVTWVPGSQVPISPSISADPRFGWVGMITSKLNLTLDLDPDSIGFDVICEYCD